NYYPPVIERALWDRVQAMRKATSAPLRGRHVNNDLRNIVGGLARCPDCDATMTRVYKGRNGGVAKLVCTTAKAGAGCEYHSVPYDDVERALIDRRKQLTRTMPGANERARELEAQRENIGAQIDDTVERIETLTDQLSRRPSKAVGARLEQLERDLDALKE